MLYTIINYYVKHFTFPHRGWKYFKKILKFSGIYSATFCKKIHNGRFIYVSPREHIQKDIFWYGQYEKEAVLLFEALIHKKSIVLDIGANIGYFTIVAAHKATQGKVYAFEPSSYLFKKLQENVYLNRFNNIEIENVAAGDYAKRQILLHLSNEDNLGTTGFAAADNFSGKTELVKSIPLDEWVNDNKIDSIDIIKIDVEGYDKKVLEGLQESIKRFMPVVFIEIVASQLSRFNNLPAEIYDFFSSLNYKAYFSEKQYCLTPAFYMQEAYNIIFVPEFFQIPSSIKITQETTSTHQ